MTDLHTVSNILDLSSGVSLIISEESSNVEKIQESVSTLEHQGYKSCLNYLTILDALNTSQTKLYYHEQSDRLNSSVLEIVAEFDSGIVSLADNKKDNMEGSRGLITANWNPNEVSLILLMTRTQIESSYPKLFDYITHTVSI